MLGTSFRFPYELDQQDAPPPGGLLGLIQQVIQHQGSDQGMGSGDGANVGSDRNPNSAIRPFGGVLGPILAMQAGPYQRPPVGGDASTFSPSPDLRFRRLPPAASPSTGWPTPQVVQARWPGGPSSTPWPLSPLGSTSSERSSIPQATTEPSFSWGSLLPPIVRVQNRPEDLAPESIEEELEETKPLIDPFSHHHIRVYHIDPALDVPPGIFPFPGLGGLLGGAGKSAGSAPARGTRGSGPVVRGEAGRFADLDARRVIDDGLTPHHMPQAALGFTSRADGGALMMPYTEHMLTRTYAYKGVLTAKNEADMAFRPVLARDLRDVRRIGGVQYNPGLLDLLGYYRTNFPKLMLKTD